MGLARDSAASISDRRFSRERQARLQAEAIAEQGLRDLFQRQQEIQLLGAIAEAANSARTVADAMKSALDAICSYMSWPIGRYCAVVTDSVEETHRVVPTDTWHVTATAPEHAVAPGAVRRLADELGLAGRVLATGAPLWIGDIAKDAPSDAVAGPRSSSSTLQSAFGLPVLAGREVAAVLEFFGPPSAGPDHSRLELFKHIGVQLGRVIERERARERTVDAFHDSLTRLPNRALFLRFVERALKRKERYASCHFAVLFIDLDGFKAVNDSLGHRVGDELLLQIGLRLAQTIRSSDAVGRITTEAAGSGVTDENSVARLGGDEFTVLLEDIGEVRHALQVADRIHSALAAPFTLEPGGEVYAPASIGIAWSRLEHTSAEDVLQDADIAMYRAKAAGKNRTAIFDEDMHQQAVARLQLETDLRRAVPRSELSLAYQPIVRVDSADIVGFEALVRWHHPTRGVVFPSAFISIAEDRGMILEIGNWVLREACRQLRVWHDTFNRPSLTIAVNLSARQFAQVDLVAQIADVIRETGIDASCLTLELTESIAMGSPKESRQQLAALRQIGVNLAIDDFGTGHSSLSYLGQFRVSSLKIDRSFIQQLDEDYGETLVRAVLSLGTNLGLRVVAEGVETARESSHLQRLGCTYAQGFYFHAPLTAASVVRLLTH